MLLLILILCVCLSCSLEEGVDIEVGHVLPCQEEQISCVSCLRMRQSCCACAPAYRTRNTADLAVTGRRSSFRVQLLDRRTIFFYRKFSLLRLSRFYSWGLVQYGGRRMEILMTVRKIASICTMVGIYFPPEFPL